ncbi:MAG: SIR2 family protein [Rouxiella aceris]|uniref:SIR2 family protein n=1 Tax=Rouxiella aceris TaxID=2703884 RepID=UPI00284D90C3|nr:SIR2 family protein [Rouxiella aceris]MDR3430899.1 SIR2 family protein [Rouxiella aceris]
MEEINQKISSIINANNENSLAIFVGAGLSKTTDNEHVKLPSWDDLINELKADLNICDETDPLKIAQLYYIEFGEFLYKKKIKKFFPENIKPSQAHKFILDLNVNTIITTNWDVLLENSIQENAYIYDVISSDQDLVKSSLPKKIIKMHGDFKNNNIVFKEDDYINYSYNFPLIENYVKSIISTHTVLFIGYSYNDIDLKQIVKWSQNHSDVRPPMYLVVFKENKTQRKYLENHGITTILLNSSASNESYSKLTTEFIEKIKNNNIDGITSSNSETINFIYKRLIRFSQMNAILIEQINLALTNCRFNYISDNEAIIEFRQSIETTNYNINISKIYKKFIEILSSHVENEVHDNPKLGYIFQTFRKAGIIGVHLKNDESNSKITHYYEFKNAYAQRTDLIYNCCLNFNENSNFNYTNDIQSLLDNAYIYYLKNDQENTYQALDMVVSECLKQKSYTQLFISIFNKNIILNYLRYSSIPIHRVKYSNIQYTDINELYANLPKDLRLTLEPIYKFINFDFLYRHNYNVDEQLKNKENAMDNISSGGITFQNNIYEPAFQHNNLLSFLIKNRIMIDNDQQIKELNEKFISISVIRQFQKNEVELNKLELYSCIKMVRNDELMSIINIPYKKAHKLKPKLKAISISTENKDWLVRTVLFSLITEYAAPNKNSQHRCEEIQNVMFLIASISLPEEDLEFVFECIRKLINSERNEIATYHAINEFLGIRYNLFEGEIKSIQITETLETIIDKLAYGRYNGNDFNAITRHKLSNLYNYAKITKSKFKKTKSITDLLSEFKDASDSNKISLCIFLLFSVYDISNKPIIGKINKFAISIDTSTVDEYKKIEFELLLVKLKVKTMSTKTKTEIIDHITKLNKNHCFSSNFQYIKHLLMDILKELEDKELNEALIILDSMIKIHDTNPAQSIF